jgi:hypothetical protein
MVGSSWTWHTLNIEPIGIANGWLQALRETSSQKLNPLLLVWEGLEVKGMKSFIFM